MVTSLKYFPSEALRRPPKNVIVACAVKNHASCGLLRL